MESIATVNTPNFILTILLSTISYYKGAKLFTFLRFMILYMIMSKSLIFFLCDSYQEMSAVFFHIVIIGYPANVF